MERYRQLWPYTAVDREFFEPYARHRIDPDDFEAIVRRQLPADWTLNRSGVWLQAQPGKYPWPIQGWKIHVSSVASTARIVLAITAAILIANRVAFKFAGDLRLLAAINGKRWPRGGAGKFITVYPADIGAFRRLLDDLAAALGGYAGPYVLTDRRHPDCPIVSYRYGGMLSAYRIDASGRREWLLRRPDGTVEPDDRAPGYRVPDWLADPLGSEATADVEVPSLGGGRFHILKALTFSAAGGIYVADDLFEGRRVVIKEARPYIGAAEPVTASLRKEFRLLRRLAPLGVAPRPVAYFREWEHSFLAEELLEGETLRAWLGKRYPALRLSATRADVARYFDDVCEVFTHFAVVLERIHEAGISIGDLSFHNVIVDPARGVRLVDLETAVEHGLDQVADAWTPGFAAAHASRDTHADARAADRYAFGANLFAACAPVNALLALDPPATRRFLDQFVHEMGYPKAWAELVTALMHPSPGARPDPVRAMASLREAVAAMPRDAQVVGHRLGPPPSIEPGRATRLFSYLERHAAESRSDRFVPAGPEVFESHPYGIAHGAAGVLHAYQRARRRPPANLLPWLCAGIRAGGERGAGLMGGDAGIAWVLLDAGETTLAMSLLQATPMEGAICDAPGLDDGIAGWGLARLKAWHATRDRACLDAAIGAGAWLLARAAAEGALLHWPTGKQQALGLAGGASGIALFFLHLHVATHEPGYLVAARRALDFDLAQAVAGADGLPSWPAWRDAGVVLPYLREGTAGVLAVAARMHAYTGDARYRASIIGAERDLFRRHAIRPGLFHGLAGIGDALLDLAACLPDRAPLYRDEALRVAGGITPFLLPRGDALAVPGSELARISCDLATGNAGVGAFLERLAQGGGASFMLDEALPAIRPRCRWPHEPRAWRAQRRNFASASHVRDGYG